MSRVRLAGSDSFGRRPAIRVHGPAGLSRLSVWWPELGLGQRPPARIYVPCSNHYPRPLIHPEPCEWRRGFPLDKDGFIRVGRRKVFITSALRHLHVSLERVTETAWEVRWGEILLGRINERELERGILPARRKRGEVSTLSLK